MKDRPGDHPTEPVTEDRQEDAGTLPFDGEAPGGDRFTTVGAELRRERELRDITLQEISEDTKISVRNLKALEENDFQRLPGGIYTKNFIRAYCHYLGINEEKMVNHYLYQTSPRAEPAGRPEGPAQDGGPSLKAVGVVLAAAVAVIAVAVLVWAIIRYPQWFGFADASTPAGAPSQGTGADSGTSAQPLEFAFEALKDTWIQVTVDGEPRIVRILKKGESFQVTARKDIVLGVQDAGALAWRINGRSARSLGGEGEVVTDFAVGHDNWQGLLDAEP